MFNTRHIKGNFVRDTDSINSSLIEEKSNEYEVKPRIREYREKQSKTAIIDKTKENRSRRIKLRGRHPGASSAFLFCGQAEAV